MADQSKNFYNYCAYSTCIFKTKTPPSSPKKSQSIRMRRNLVVKFHEYFLNCNFDIYALIFLISRQLFVFVSSEAFSFSLPGKDIYIIHILYIFQEYISNMSSFMY